MSQSAVIQAIASYGPISRASVAKQTGLSKQTVSEIVAALENDGWVQVVGQTEGNIGRRAVVYEIAPSAATVASVDLGGTKVRVALCDLTGKVLVERVESTHESGGIHVVDQIVRMIQSSAEEPDSSFGKLRIAVIGVPGVPDEKTGGILLAPNIKGIDQIDLAGSIEERLGVEVFVENDVNLAALGEHWLANSETDDNLVFISVGTGIGAGLVVGGNLLRGSTGGAGEIGFLPFGADPFDEESLSVGALERVAATNAIVELYHSLSGKKTDVPGVFDAAGAGDAAAAQTLDEVAKQIARGAAALVAVVDPSSIILGGSIGVREELLARVQRYMVLCCPKSVAIKKSQLNDHAALAGGASVALSHLHTSLFAEGQKGAEISVPPPDIASFKAGAS
ncbi:ROK family transcriptional regulator [Halocynthiibacter sp. C4]|uniref:ROK family transcriptional regulator n=1 Tax=Halocynthiibacter sp. C4 TaxID=2992758 RepID=UPI00237B734C|nr:ROK family transcriptional regulator [Halocynthiibacter sp. C4]MDE0591504.1 ROK family transcriptional regulator [Halocynthiibacter sp. C4]